MLGSATTAHPTPEEWLARFETTIADVKAKTEAFQQNLEQAGVTEAAPDGSISVSVAPNGSLNNLHVDDSAMRGSGAEPAGKTMKLARKAQRAAAVNVAEAFAPMGAGSEAMHMLTGYLPEPEEDEDDEQERPGYAFNDEAAPPVPPTPPRRPVGAPGATTRTTSATTASSVGNGRGPGRARPATSEFRVTTRV
jgi:DNA-binding protein YbaB